MIMEHDTLTAKRQNRRHVSGTSHGRRTWIVCHPHSVQAEFDCQQHFDAFWSLLDVSPESSGRRGLLNEQRDFNVQSTKCEPCGAVKNTTTTTTTLLYVVNSGKHCTYIGAELWCNIEVSSTLTLVLIMFDSFDRHIGLGDVSRSSY